MSPKGYRKAVQGASDQTNTTIQAVSEQARQLETLVSTMHGIGQRMQRVQATLRLASAQLATRRNPSVSSQSAMNSRGRGHSRARPLLQQRTPMPRARSFVERGGQPIHRLRRQDGPASADPVLQRS
jgi:hypothetical protein